MRTAHGLAAGFAVIGVFHSRLELAVGEPVCRAFCGRTVSQGRYCAHFVEQHASGPPLA